ncbi:MAG: acyl-CoA dehydrogenase family protein, partial [Flavobacteriales bacterium]
MPTRFKHTKLQEIYDGVCQFTQTAINPLIQSNNWNQAWKKAGEYGLLSGCVPAEKGGNGLSLEESMAGIEGFSFSCIDGGFTFCVVACWSASVIPLSQHGSSQQIEKWLKPVVNGDTSCSNAITEQGAGSDIASMSSKAVEKNKSYTINANKCFISNASRAGFILLYALTNPEKKLLGGLSVFIVQKSEFNITGDYKLSGFDSFSLSELEVKDEVLSADRLVGAEGAGFGIFLQSMNVERMVMSA